MSRKVRTIWNIFSGAVVALAIGLAVALVGVRLAGLSVYTVLSGSMEPALPTGSLIYVRKTDPASLRPGDVITFLLDNDTVATHRITEVIFAADGERLFQTKGDANSAPDAAAVHERNVLGTPVLAIPALGYFARYIQRPPGSYAAISVGAILALLVFLPELLDGGKPKRRRRKKKPDGYKRARRHRA